MSGGKALRRGQFMRRDGGLWRICLLKEGVIHFQNEQTNETDKLTVEDFQNRCYEGTIEMVDDPNASLDEKTRELLQVPLRDMPSKMQAAAERAHFYVSAFLDPVRFYELHVPDVPTDERHIPRAKSRAQVKPFLVHIATAWQQKRHAEGVAITETPPGFSTLCAWLSKYERAGVRDARTLAPRYDNRGPRRRYMVPRVLDWLDEAIDKVYLTTQQNTRKAVYTALEAKVNAENRKDPDASVQMPSARQVSRYINEEVDRFVEKSRRDGKAAADKEFQPVGKGPEPDDILDVVEVDHVRANVEVCDDITGRKLGRPWITTALDRHSRMPVGVHVHFDGQSLGAVTQCLRNAMQPKSFLRKLCPEINYHYPCTGVPVAYFFDRGADFDSDFMREIGLTFDIRLDYEPAGCPQYKGKLERWHRTMAEEVAHPLRGATPPHNGKEFRRDPDGKAYVTFNAFVRRLWFWIAMVYVHEPHRGIRDIPLRKWRSAEQRRLPRPVRKKDDLDILLNRVEYLIPSNKGLTWQHLRWNGEVIKRIRSHPSFDRSRRLNGKIDITNEEWLKDTMGGRLKVRINEHDLGAVSVTDPVSRKPVRVEAVDKEYQSGLSLYQHRMCMLLINETDGERDSETRLWARNKLIEDAQAHLRQTNGRQKAITGVARYSRIGAVAPAGDDLGSLAGGMPLGPGSEAPPLLTEGAAESTPVDSSETPSEASQPEEPRSFPTKKVRNTRS
jgi:hypothetical protein